MLFGELDLVMGSKSDYNESLPQKEMEDDILFMYLFKKGILFMYGQIVALAGHCIVFKV